MTATAPVKTGVKTPVSAASVAVFRILFGIGAAVGAVRFLLKGWVESLYLAPTHHFTYYGFDWVQPLPAPLMYAHTVVLAVLGVCIALGYRYRLAVGLYAAAFLFGELIDATYYLNHYWWVTVAAVVMIFLPLDQMWSLDARAGRVAKADVTGAWVVWTVRAMLAVVYVFAGIAKLQTDWLVDAMPLKYWLADDSSLPLVGPLLALPEAAYAFSWAGAFFDCTIVGWLLWRRSRPFAYVAVIAFHVATAVLFPIGMFPWLMIMGTLVFFDPDWPLRLARRRASLAGQPRSPGRATVAALAAIAVLSVLIPLRHLAYEGDVRWTEEGYYGSWHVMLTEKTGTVNYRVTDPQTGDEWTVNPRSILTPQQTEQAAIRPDFIVQTAQFIENEARHEVEVRADAFVTMNGRSYQRFIDPDVDLTRVSRAPGHKDYVLRARADINCVAPPAQIAI